MNKKNDIKSKMLKGAAWMITLKFSVRIIGFISTLILARLLIPEDFAIIALATTVLGILYSMSEFRLDNALIQNQNITENHYHTAWTMGLIRAIMVALLLFLVTNWTSEFYNEPRLKNVLLILVVVTILDGFQSVRIVDFRKNFEFHKEFIFLIFPKLISFFVTITLAVILENYWALIIGIVVYRVIQTISSYIIAPYQPRLCLQHSREILSFSVWLWLSSVLGFIARRIDQLLIGKFVGTRMMGIYNIAHEIGSLPTTEIVWPMAKAFLPGFAKFSSSKKDLLNLYYEVIYTTCLIGFPVAIGLALVADYAIPVLLGDKWLETIPLIKIIVIAGVIELSIANVTTIYLAAGFPKYSFLHTLIVGILKIIIVFAGVYHFGAIGAAWALIISSVFAFIIGLIMGYYLLSISPYETLKAISKPFLYILVMAASVILLQKILIYNNIISNWILLISSIITGIFSYVAPVFSLWHHNGKPDGIESRIYEKLFSVHP